VISLQIKLIFYEIIIISALYQTSSSQTYYLDCEPNSLCSYS